jgi:quercetin dioxygenase-like cupin family protein
MAGAARMDRTARARGRPGKGADGGGAMIAVSQPDRAQAQPPDQPEYFAGKVAMQKLSAALGGGEVELIAVFFDGGARTIPHTHATDQVLLVVAGRCVVADEDGRRELGPGELARIPAERWHWHGAAPGESACHLSIRRPGPSDWTVPKRDW